jgi:hypothetical protein
MVQHRKPVSGRCRACGLALVLLASHGAATAATGRGLPLWDGRGECAQTPAHTEREETDKAELQRQQHGNNAVPHKKKSGKLSGPSLRALPSLGPGSFLAGRAAANAAAFAY